MSINPRRHWSVALAIAAVSGLLASPLGVVGPPLAATAAVMATVYVSPTGDDARSGTTPAQAVRTLARAQQLVRSMNQNMTGDIRVELANGEYRMASTLALNASDSGTGGFSVIWAAAAGARPVVSGGIPVTGWIRTNATRNIWSAPVPAGTNTRQLYVNGVRAVRARGAAPVTLTWTASGYNASGGAMSTWRNKGDLEFVYTKGLGAWTEIRCSVGRIASNGTVSMGQPCWNNSNQRHIKTDWDPPRTANLVGPGRLGNPGPEPGGPGIPPTYVENAFELLDSAGEWYLDRPANTVHYIPRSGENLATAKVIAPVLQTLVSGHGTAAAPVHHVIFDGLQFSDATWLRPSSDEGFSEIQAGYTITGTNGYAVQGLCQFAPGGTCPYASWTKEPANVSFSYAHHVQFRNGGFARLGAAGLDFGNGASDNVIRGNVFTDISGNGIELGGVDKPLATGADRTSRNEISNNRIFRVAAEYHGGVGIIVGYSERTLITHNQIDTLPYTGISMGWGGWPDKKQNPQTPNYSNRAVVSNNHIFMVMQMLDDGGGVYTQGLTGSSLETGQQVSGNLIHDLGASHQRAVYTDNGATYLTIRGNGMYKTAQSWASNHTDYRDDLRNFDPLLIEENWWDRGAADSNSKKVVIRNNHPITSPNQIPASIVNNAGLESAFKGLLNWRPVV